MRALLLALALLPGAAAMGKYVPDFCTETPGGHVKKVGTGGAESRETAPPAPEE